MNIASDIRILVYDGAAICVPPPAYSPLSYEFNRDSKTVYYDVKGVLNPAGSRLISIPVD